MFIDGYIKSEFIRHLAVIICIFSGLLYSNENELEYSKNIVGLRGGLSYASFTGSDTDAYDPEFAKGLSLGGFLDIGINKYFSLQLELNYIEKGAEDFEEFIEFYEPESYWNPGLYFKEKVIYSYQLKYIELPVLVKFHTMKISNIYPSVYCGLSAAVNIEAKMDVQDGEISEFMEVVEEEQGIEDFIDDKEYNAIFGTSIDYVFNKFKVFCDFRYNMGLKEVFEQNEFDYKNSVFIITVGFGYKPSPVKRSPNQISNRYL
ncbi:MAG TPA: porin family protein [Clostridiales bacterium]|nr:porin family protein [Clostridiales bacterium]HQP70656.1 porin family protein [Clostridiales bacterium]